MPLFLVPTSSDRAILESVLRSASIEEQMEAPLFQVMTWRDFYLFLCEKSGIEELPQISATERLLKLSTIIETVRKEIPNVPSALALLPFFDEQFEELISEGFTPDDLSSFQDTKVKVFGRFS